MISTYTTAYQGLSPKNGIAVEHADPSLALKHYWTMRDKTGDAKKLRMPWVSFHMFRGGYRDKAHMLTMPGLIVLDIDDPADEPVTMARLLAIATPLGQHVIHSSFSHNVAKPKKKTPTPACPRFRLVFALTRECRDEVEFIAVTKALALHFTAEGIPVGPESWAVGKAWTAAAAGRPGFEADISGGKLPPVDPGAHYTPPKVAATVPLSKAAKVQQRAEAREAAKEKDAATAEEDSRTCIMRAADPGFHVWVDQGEGYEWSALRGVRGWGGWETGELEHTWKSGRCTDGRDDEPEVGVGFIVAKKNPATMKVDKVFFQCAGGSCKHELPLRYVVVKPNPNNKVADHITIDPLLGSLLIWDKVVPHQAIPNTNRVENVKILGGELVGGMPPHWMNEMTSDIYFGMRPVTEGSANEVLHMIEGEFGAWFKNNAIREWHRYMAHANPQRPFWPCLDAMERNWAKVRHEWQGKSPLEHILAAWKIAPGTLDYAAFEYYIFGAAAKWVGHKRLASAGVRPERLDSMLVVVGHKQIGKTTFLRDLLNDPEEVAAGMSMAMSTVVEYKPDSQFAASEVAKYLMVCFDEMQGFARSNPGLLRKVITDHASSMERKGVDADFAVRLSVLSGTTNHTNCLPAELDDIGDVRRYMLVDTRDNVKSGDTAIIDRLREVRPFLMGWAIEQVLNGASTNPRGEHLEGFKARVPHYTYRSTRTQEAEYSVVNIPPDYGRPFTLEEYRQRVRQVIGNNISHTHLSAALKEGGYISDVVKVKGKSYRAWFHKDADSAKARAAYRQHIKDR